MGDVDGMRNRLFQGRHGAISFLLTFIQMNDARVPRDR
jgi:hypothetical protein